MCEKESPSGWDNGGLLKSISPITNTVDDSVDKVLDIIFL
jgi:hypothetical protein